MLNVRPLGRPKIINVRNTVHLEIQGKPIPLIRKSLPKGPSRTKNTTDSEFGTGRKFGTDAAKRYGDGSEMLVFPGKRGRKTAQKVKNYGKSKILRIRAYYF